MESRHRINRHRFRNAFVLFALVGLTFGIYTFAGARANWDKLISPTLFDPVTSQPEVGQLTLAAPKAQPMAPYAPDAPEDIVCRPEGAATDQVRIQWLDTNNKNADYRIQRQDVSSGSWSNLTTVAGNTCNDDDVCVYVDSNASNSTVYRYRVRAEENGDNSSYTTSCREPLVLNDTAGNFRGFYRLTECPNIDGKQVCTQNVNNGSGNNTHMAQMLATHEQYRQEYIDLGFTDFAIYDGSKPFPIDLYPCNNGCANSLGIQIPPANLEATNYNPATGSGEDYEYFVVGHEGFHIEQGLYGNTYDPYYKWVIEGQARSTEDKVCVFNSADCALWDNQIDKYYTGAVQSYLGFPEQGIQDASYIAALFWTYITEQFGTSTNEPSYGMDALVAYWEQNLVNHNASNGKDGIGTLNDMFSTLGSSRQFGDVFEDFAVANYAKEYLSNPAPAGFERYNYIDEETFTGGTYGTVKLTESGPLGTDDVIFGTTSIQAWGARYFEVDPDPAVPVVNFEVETLVGTPHSLYYKVLAIDNNNIVDQWDDSGTTFELSVSNASNYDRLVMIVVSHGNPTNFNYGINLADGLFILSPNAQFQAAVGEATSPEKFILQLQVLDSEGDPVAGIDTSLLTMTVGSTVINPPAVPADDPIIGSAYLGGQYWITVRAPASPGCTVCDLTVAYSGYSDTEADAIVYGPKPDVDNMIVIDRSGSMEGEKIVAAQTAAKLYVDSYSTGDKVGVLSFNSAPNLEYSLHGWDNNTRIDAQDAIDDIDPPEGNTANGAALREATDLLENQDTSNPDWAIVLLSDGKDTVEDTDDHIAKYVSDYKAKKKDGDQVPVVHVVAVGDDADGVELSKITNESGGLFQFLPVPGEVAVAGGNATDVAPLSQALAEIYRTFAEDMLDEQQVYVNHFSNPTNVVENPIPVEQHASQGIFVVNYSPPNATLPTIGLIPPSGTTLADAIAPTLTAPGHLLWRVPAPEAGDWNLLMRFGCGDACPNDYMVEAALVSDLTLKAFLGVPVEDRVLGMPMPIVAFLSDIAPLTGATMTALSERTGETITLHDDGQHGDGAANDGAYGGTLKSTNVPGGYSVVIDADGTSPFSGQYKRRVRLSFYLADGPDTDEDRLPNWWEIENGTDPNVPDANQDPDGDDLPNSQEFFRKTKPLDPDTDDGGENDGSEVGRGADPLVSSDDGQIGSVAFQPWPGPGRAILRLAFPLTTSSFTVDRAPAPEGPFTPVAEDLSPQEEWVDQNAPNDQQACYRVRSSGRGYATTSPVRCTTPKADPHPPHGVVVGTGPVAMGPGGLSVQAADARPRYPQVVTLLLDAEDTPGTEEHPAFDGAFLFADATISGVSEMQISNRADFEGATWEPYKTTKRWTLAPRADGLATVFVRFRDAAGNVSDIATDTFLVDAGLPSDLLYLPLLDR